MGRGLIGSPGDSDMPYPRRSRGPAEPWIFAQRCRSICTEPVCAYLTTMGSRSLFLEEYFLLWKPVPGSIYGRRSFGSIGRHSNFSNFVVLLSHRATRKSSASLDPSNLSMLGKMIACISVAAPTRSFPVRSL